MQQIVLILFFSLLPLFLYFSDRKMYLGYWIVTVASIDAFAAMRYGNITALKITGIVLFPIMCMNFKDFFEDEFGKKLLIFSIYLSIVSIYFGFFDAWPDTTGERGFMDLSIARAVKQLGTYFSELSIIWFIAKRIHSRDRIKLFKWLLGCSFLVSLSLIFESVVRVDLYSFLTEGRALLIDRARGLSYEPRGAAQILVYGLILLLTMKVKRNYVIMLTPFLLAGFFLAYSMTGVILLLVGGMTVAFCRLYLIDKIGIKKGALVLGILVSFLSLGGLYISKNDKLLKHYSGRLYILNKANIVEKLEVFDAAAMNFFKHNPSKMVFGVGAGQMGLASSPYIIERDKRYWGNRIDGLPHMGLVYQLSQVGVLGVLILIILLVPRLRSVYSEDIRLFSIILAFLVCYTFQMRYFFPLVLGCLWSSRLSLEDEK